MPNRLRPPAGREHLVLASALASGLILLIAGLGGLPTSEALAATATSPAEGVSSEGVPDQASLLLVTPDGAPAPQGRVHLVEAVAASANPTEHTVLPFDGSGRLPLDVPRGSTWRVLVESDGFWAPERLVQVTSGPPTEIPLFPTSTLQATLQVPHGWESPSRVTLSFTSAPGSGSKPQRPKPQRPKPPLDTPERGDRVAKGEIQGTVPCRLVPRGDALDGTLARCQVPAGELDLRFHAPGFAAVHRWGVEVGPGKVLVVDTLELQPGASLTGRLRLEEPSEELREQDPGARLGPNVRLRPLTTKGAAGTVASRLESLARSATPNERGFFQFIDVAPGAYLVEAEAPGLAPARLFPIRVYEGKESNVGDLELTRPAGLALQLDPPLDPADARWQVQLESRTRISATEAEEARDLRADFQGFFTLDDLVPGTYSLRVSSGRSLWHRRDVEIQPGTNRVEIDLGLARVAGVVQRGEEPVRTRLTFYSSQGQVDLYSDFDGRFSGALPAAGTWHVTALFRRDGSRQELGPVQVESRDGDAEATWLEIEVADTRLIGVVVDARGRAVPDAELWLRSEDESERRPSRARSDLQGSFLFEGLPPGNYLLDALDGLRRGNRIEVALRNGRDTEARIRLRDSLEVHGSVRDPEGRPLTGVQVLLYPELEIYRRLPIERLTTGPDGRYALSVPADTRSLRVAVLPPGFAARIFETPFQPGEPMDIQVSNLGGTLILDLASEDGNGGNGHGTEILGRDEGAFWVEMLRPWAELHGQSASRLGRWILPAMEMGSYSLCASGSESCTRGYLPPEGQLVLSLAH